MVGTADTCEIVKSLNKHFVVLTSTVSVIIPIAMTERLTDSSIMLPYGQIPKRCDELAERWTVSVIGTESQTK